MKLTKQRLIQIIKKSFKRDFMVIRWTQMMVEKVEVLKMQGMTAEKD